MERVRDGQVWGWAKENEGSAWDTIMRALWDTQLGGSGNSWISRTWVQMRAQDGHKCQHRETFQGRGLDELIQKDDVDLMPPNFHFLLCNKRRA